MKCAVFLSAGVLTCFPVLANGPLGFSTNLPGTNYFVATNGSGGNTGLTTNSPWPLSYAVTQLGPGITLTLMPGVYPGTVQIYYVSGTALNPATVRSQYKWQAVIANSAARGIEIWESQYIVLDGICVSNSTGSGIKVMDSDNTVRNCWVTHNGNVTDDEGIDGSFAGTTNDLYECNLIEFNGSGAGQGHGLYVSGQNHIVRGNVVRRNGGYGIQLFTGVAGNLVNSNYVYNNLTYGNTNKYGVTIWAADGNGNYPGTNYLFNNTMLDGAALNYGAAWVTNNIILPSPINSTQPIAVFSSPPVIWSDYNLGTNTITPAGAHDVITNYVGFVNPGNGLYWLKSDSPARGHALSTVCGPVDFFGNAQSSASDIGAFQYNGVYSLDMRVLDPSPVCPDYWLVLTQPIGPTDFRIVPFTNQ
jgi:hypothetical protein